MTLSGWLQKKTNKQTSSAPKRGRTNLSARSEEIAGWLFSSPLIIGLLVFTLTPMVCSLLWSFKDFNGTTKDTWVGLANYVKIFTGDYQMGTVVKNTLIYTALSIPINLILSYLLAWLVNNKHKFTKFFRVLYYLPCVIPAVATGLLWTDMMDYDFGIFNKILTAIGLSKFPFFSQESSNISFTSMFSLLLMNCWSLGSGMILWLSAFKNIPSTLYEAAKIDGANAIQRFGHITIPLSTPIIFYNLVTSVIGTLQYTGTLIIAPRQGKGYDDSLYLYGVKIYFDAFKRGQIGYACSLSWLLCIVITILTVILFRSSKWVFYGENA